MAVHRRLRRLRRRTRPLLLLLAVLGTGLLAACLAVGISLPGVKDDLERSRANLVAAQNALARADLPAARQSLARGRASALSAEMSSHRVTWRVLAHVPVMGRAVREVQAVTRAVAVTSGRVLPPLVELDLGGPRAGRIDTAPLRAARQPLSRAVAELAAARRDLRAAPTSGIGRVVAARLELDDTLTRLARSLREARVASEVVPELLAGDRRFLLVVQNNAEMRATGGLVGAYGVVEVHDGRVRLGRFGPNQDLVDPAVPPLDLGTDFDQRYGRFQAARTWRSANLTPDTPTAGRLLASLWRQQTGEAVDGVLLVDPVGLARVLRATGPVRLADGTRLTADNAVRTLLVEAYARFPRELDADRNAYLQQAARAVLDRFVATPASPRWARAVAGAATSGHLQVWSAEPALQGLLEQSVAGGALGAQGPYLQVVTQDVGGSKLGPYLRRAVTYVGSSTGEAVDLGDGPVDEEQAVITVEMANQAPARLPEYVTLRPDDPRAPTGQAKTWLSVYLGRGATLLRATLDGRPVQVQTGSERGLAVFSVFVTTDRGGTSRLVLHVRQPAAPGAALLWRQQPLLQEDVLTVRRQGAPLDRFYTS